MGVSVIIINILCILHKPALRRYRIQLCVTKKAINSVQLAIEPIRGMTPIQSTVMWSMHRNRPQFPDHRDTASSAATARPTIKMRANTVSYRSPLLSVIATEIRRPAGGNSIKKFRPDEFISINRNIIYNFHSPASPCLSAHTHRHPTPLINS